MLDIFHKKLLFTSAHHLEDISNDDDLDIFGKSDDEHTEDEDEDASPNKIGVWNKPEQPEQ